jgi:effector-binding domain-containing protein
MNRKHTPSSLLGTVLCATALHAQTPAPKPSPIDPAIAALLAKIAANGRDASATSLLLEGTYEVTFQGAPEPVAKGACREVFVGKELSRSTSDLGDMGKMENGMQGDLVWSVDPSLGARLHRGTAAAATRRMAAASRQADPRETYREFAVVDGATIDGEPCTGIRMTPAEGRPDVFFVDAAGRVRRIVTALPAPESADAAFGMDDLMETTITYSDFRTEDGRTFARKRTLAMGPATVTTTLTRVRVGEKVDPAVFAPPPAVAEIELAPLQPAFDAEGKPTYQIVARKVQPVASIRVKIKASEISKQLAILLPEVYAHVNATGAKTAGPPFSRYHSVADGEIDIEAGIPVQKPIEAKGRVVNSELPAGRTVTCWHKGPYDQLSGAHEALQAHLASQKLKARGGAWEVYWTDPGMVPEPSKWKTQLFAPIE